MDAKILLITTSFEEISKLTGAKTSEEMHYPIGLAYLHAYLKSKGHHTKMLCLNHTSYEDCFKKLIETVKEFSPQIVGFQVLTSNRISTYNSIEHLHKNFPDIKIILGGIHATIMYEQLIKKYPFTIVVLGEGERTMEELSKELLNKKPNFERIDGIAYFDKKVIRTKTRELINLDEAPFPSHELFLKNRDCACILTSRGCPMNCSFCCLNPESKRKVRFRSPKNVVDEIEYIARTFPWIKKIWIHDDSFFIDNQRVINICDELLKRKIKMNFTCSGRMKPVSKEMIQKLEQTGFKEVLLGLESGSERILKSCHKGITPEDVINTFRLFSKSNISVKIFLIVGLPGETIYTINETINLVRRIQKIKYILMGSTFNLLTIYPGTEVYEIAKEKKFIDDEYWLTDKECPIYTAENNYEKLKYFEKHLSTNLSIYKIKTWKGFLPQIVMVPYALKYFLKKKKSWKKIKIVLRDFFK